MLRVFFLYIHYSLQYCIHSHARRSFCACSENGRQLSLMAAGFWSSLISLFLAISGSLRGAPGTCTHHRQHTQHVHRYIYLLNERVSRCGDVVPPQQKPVSIDAVRRAASSRIGKIFPFRFVTEVCDVHSLHAM